MAVTQGIGSTGRAGLFTPFPAYVNHHTVTTVEDETVPAAPVTGVIITPTADIWLALGTGTAVVPSSDVVDGTGSFHIGAHVARGFNVTAGQKLSVVSASGTALVSFEYFL